MRIAVTINGLHVTRTRGSRAFPLETCRTGFGRPLVQRDLARGASQPLQFGRVEALGHLKRRNGPGWIGSCTFEIAQDFGIAKTRDRDLPSRCTCSADRTRSNSRPWTGTAWRGVSTDSTDSRRASLYSEKVYDPRLRRLQLGVGGGQKRQTKLDAIATQFLSVCVCVCKMVITDDRPCTSPFATRTYRCPGIHLDPAIPTVARSAITSETMSGNDGYRSRFIVTPEMI